MTYKNRSGGQRAARHIEIVPQHFHHQNKPEARSTVQCPNTNQHVRVQCVYTTVTTVSSPFMITTVNGGLSIVLLALHDC